MNFLESFLSFLNPHPGLSSVPAFDLAPDKVLPVLTKTRIVFVNKSTSVSDDDLRAAIPAFQTQISRDFAPIWGVDATLRMAKSPVSNSVIPPGGIVQTPPIPPRDDYPPQAGEWIVYIMDTSDQAGDLGYHQRDTLDNPEAFIFVKDDIRYGLSWTVTISHELLEMLVDPLATICVISGDRLYAYEVADACEEDTFGYKIGDTLVSDFVFPAWFEDDRKVGSTQFDFCRHINAPFQLIQGGYIGYLELSSPAAGWKQLTAQSTNRSTREHTRLMKRRTETVQVSPPTPGKTPNRGS